MTDHSQSGGEHPAPQRTSQTRAAFLRSQARAIIAADFFEAATLSGARLYVLAIIEPANRTDDLPVPVLCVCRLVYADNRYMLIAWLRRHCENQRS